MNSPDTKNRKWPVKRTVLLSFLAIVTLAGIYLYRNFNHLLSQALLNSFNSSVISDVYELKFENLQINLYNGSIRVFNVSVRPREKPLKDYPYINSSLSLKTENLLLENVEIRTLLRENRLILTKILISEPEIEFLLNGSRHIMFPFKDTTLVATKKSEDGKRPIESFSLNEFRLSNAVFHSLNSEKQREFKIEDLNLSMDDLLVGEESGGYLASLSRIALSIGKFAGELKKGSIERLGFENFQIGFDSLKVHFTLDTLTYQFQDFQTAMHALNIQTADSMYQVSMKSFDLSYDKKVIIAEAVSFKPNVSHAIIQKDYQYQHTEFSGSLGNLDLKDVNFDSLIYANKLFVGEVELRDVKAAIFKDKSKPIDSARFPVYLGQTISGIKLPLLIKKVRASNVELVNTERKPDGTDATVKINRAKLEVNNVTNLAPKEKLEINADAFINGKVRFTSKLAFSYSNPQFSFEGTLNTFNLPDLNDLIQAYTPAKINKGIADEISFSGLAENTSASGTMKFLYHNLEIDLELEEKAKWKSSVIAFAANTALNSSNPPSSDLPPRIVRFQIQRDMNKGFVNLILKSVLNGLKETMIMSKENRKTYKEAKKKGRE